MQTIQQNSGNELKNMDFLVWRVSRAKAAQKHGAVHRALFQRPRLRPTRH